MDLTNEFRVALPVERAWAVLTDLERIAPCMPGAQLQEVEGDEYRGIVKVKVGPITAQYKGMATFTSLDAPREAVLRAEGRETRGQGNASATITATLTPDEGGTKVSVVTDLTITGRVAQFGRGVLAEVSAKLLDQFVASLEQTVLAGEPDAAEPTGGAPADVELGDPMAAVEPDADDLAAAGPTVSDAQPSPTDAPITTPEPIAVSEAPAATPGPAGPRKIDMPEPTPVDLIGAAGTPVAKRVAPILAIVAVAWILKKLLSRK